MIKSDFPFHYVCTREEALELIKDVPEFWVSNCGCREPVGCTHSRLDVCLFFKEYERGSGSNIHKVSKEEVAGIFREAKVKNLVTRPFRDFDDMSKTGGICFCCPECCSYFKNKNESCDPGTYIEKTDMDQCIDCGLCVDICYFGARNMVEGELVISQDKCFGCGLCIDICPVKCIELVQRNGISSE